MLFILPLLFAILTTEPTKLFLSLEPDDIGADFFISTRPIEDVEDGIKVKIQKKEDVYYIDGLLPNTFYYIAKANDGKIEKSLKACTKLWKYFTLLSPHSSFPLWKGQIHIHTTNSDGVETPLQMLTAYKERGYDFVCITDHDYVTEEKIEGILCIKGCEESIHTPSKMHLISIGLKKEVESKDLESVLSKIISEEGIAIAAHPNARGYEWSLSTLFHSPIHGMEIHGGAFEKWDILLGCGKKIWGFLSDDAHRSIPKNSEGGWVLDGIDGRWIMVSAPMLSLSEILGGMKRGDFYAVRTFWNAIKKPPSLKVWNEGRALHAYSKDATTIKFIGPGGILKKENASDAFYTYMGEEGEGGYIRVEAIKDGGGITYSQPIFVVKDVKSFMIKAPTSVKKGEPFTLKVVALDEEGEVVRHYNNEVEVFLDRGSISPSTLLVKEGKGEGLFRIFTTGSVKISVKDEEKKGESSLFVFAEEKIYCYPNPFVPSRGDKEIIFCNVEGVMNVKIYDILGKIVARPPFEIHEGRLRWSPSLPSGIYIGVFEFIDGRKEKVKFCIIR